MKAQLKDLYGRRVTPGVRIFILVVIIFLGLSLSFTSADRGNNKPTDKVMVE